MPTPAEVMPSEMRRLRVLFVLAIASSLAPLSMDFFAPSMPNATRDLGVAADALKSTIVLFLAGYAVGPFLWGALADRWGRRKVMLIGLGSYLLASVGCALAPGITELAVFRVLQGTASAAGIVIARAVLRDVYGPAGATRAIASMFMIMVWVPISAPLIGGFMNSLFDWRVSFVVMALVAGITLLGSSAWLAETLAPVAQGAPGERNRWVEVLTNATFMRHALANMLCVTMMMLFLSNYSYITEVMYGFTPRQNGYVLAVFNAAVSAGVYLVRATVPKIGVEPTIQAGLWMAMIGWLALWLLSLQAVAVPELMLLFVALACLGMGMVLTLTGGQALVPFTFAAGTASALFSFIQSAGASLISFAAGSLFAITLSHLGALLFASALLALVVSRVLGRMA